ncbi:MAG: pantoate--beta-alanine ligase [Actinomycetota bacterium]|nr:pantoate--beta-alanine ligase [Actinomycetota bacterium]MDK1016376.1 pantoate--beta-alanine ligase [Actinomycetota bacterium]MDK1026134.1 pantoate--beta-alanine ligase [Actinomycetota bacterium]MDK1095975.1 pantoate--beta-alanine ligase [Actinomycetota bacterium]MDK1102261.1 pantoate--beta-alanine ligase [Actinomycetota bacterium]
MKTVHEFGDVRSLAVGRVGLVLTMGFLHEGHLSLIEAARENVDTVVVSIFVNPLQFNEPSDFVSYPRDRERDAALAEAAGADVLFVPDDSTMYPSEPVTRIEVGGVADGMEGAKRPGHFAGVATVVGKLFAGTQPDLAYFGRKDAQQLAVVRTMVRDLSFPVDIVGRPIVRESEGLALSSRNVRLDPSSRTHALALSGALFQVADAFEAGERSVVDLTASIEERLRGENRVVFEYAEIANAPDAAVTNHIGTEVFLAAAIRVGNVRLIDNVYLDPVSGVADRGIRLSAPSILYEGV